MRLYLSLVVFFFTVVALSSVTFAGETQQYVQIKKPFVSVYEKLDPKSNIIKQASKSERLELVYEGTSWYQVRVNGKIGWLERSAGIVVDNPGKTILSVPVGTFLFFILLLASTIGVTLVFIYRQKVPEVI